MLPAGTKVKALPFGANETLTPEQLLDHDPYEGPRDEVSGILEIIKVPADYDFNAPAYILYIVDNTSVDPNTIKEFESESLTASTSATSIDFTGYLRDKRAEFFNERHDELGRFAPKEGSAAGAGGPGEIRKWAQENGFQVGERGRIHKDIQAAYKKAQKKTSTPKAKKEIFQEQFSKASQGLSEELETMPTNEMLGDPRWTESNGDPAEKLIAIEQRVTAVGAILHNEIMSRLEKNGIIDPVKALAQQALISQERIELADKLDAFRALAPKDGSKPFSRLAIWQKLHPGEPFNGINAKQLEEIKTIIDKDYPGSKAIADRLDVLEDQLETINISESDYALSYRTTALQVLSEARSGDYGNEPFARVLGSAREGARNTSQTVIDSVKRAGHVYPDEWVEQSNDAGYVYTETSDRGLHVFRPNGSKYEHDPSSGKMIRLPAKNSEIKTSKDSGHDPAVDKSPYFPTSVHEMGHRMEELRPHIKAIEWAFWARRTVGSPIQQLKKLRPDQNYDANEMASPDTFIDPYMGKLYQQSPRANFELFTMGVQGMLGGSSYRMYTDPDYASFILGILATG